MYDEPDADQTVVIRMTRRQWWHLNDWRAEMPDRYPNRAAEHNAAWARHRSRHTRPTPPSPRMTEPYDSAPDTLAHIDQVRELTEDVVNELRYRSLVHDASKLQAPEKAIFDIYTPKLAATTYGSDEYKSYLAEHGRRTPTPLRRKRPPPRTPPARDR